MIANLVKSVYYKDKAQGLCLKSSSVHSCHLFLISSAYVGSTSFLSFIVQILVWNVPLVSLIFLKRTLVFPILLFSSISLNWWGVQNDKLLLFFSCLWNATKTSAKSPKPTGTKIQNSEHEGERLRPNCRYKYLDQQTQPKILLPIGVDGVFQCIARVVSIGSD